VLLTRSPVVLHSLKERIAKALRKYAISQGGACVRIDRARAHRRDSVALMLENGNLVLGHSRFPCRVVLHLAGNDAKARIPALGKRRIALKRLGIARRN